MGLDEIWIEFHAHYAIFFVGGMFVADDTDEVPLFDFFDFGLDGGAVAVEVVA